MSSEKKATRSGVVTEREGGQDGCGYRWVYRLHTFGMLTCISLLKNKMEEEGDVLDL